MLSINDKIISRIRGSGRGNKVYCPVDFLDLGTRNAVDQGLVRLVKAGTIRRLGRGLYDLPKKSLLLRGDAPADIDMIIAAIARRDGVQIIPDNINAANDLGLTNAVPAKNTYLTNGPSKSLSIQGVDITIKQASVKLIPWFDDPARKVVQAIFWLGKDITATHDMLRDMRRKIPDDMKQSLLKGRTRLPGWAVNVVDAIAV